MSKVLSKRRVIVGLVAAVAVMLVAVFMSRTFLAGVTLGAALKKAGASEIHLQVTKVSLWRVVVEDISFLLRLQPFSITRVTLDRPSWWKPAFGMLRVEGVVVPVKAETLAAIAAARSDSPRSTEAGPVTLPFEEISIDGQLVIQADGVADRSLTMQIEARPTDRGVWNGSARIAGPGLRVAGEGSYDPASGAADFKLPEIALDLEAWEGFVRQLVPMPEGDWVAGGKFSGTAEGRWGEGGLAASGSVRLREGRLASTDQTITAEGVDADLDFTDFAELVSKPATLRVRELRTGKLTLTDIAAGFTIEGSDRIAVQTVALQALGGRLSAEPFVYVPSRTELDVVLVADRISIEQVMALTDDLPAKATGRVNGRVPVFLGNSGLKFGAGWLALTPGVSAEIEFNAKGLLTGGASSKSPGYTVLQKVESGLLKLRVSELRLDIKPTNLPQGRSAQLHLKGEPMDPGVKAPVILDLNVNGPLEKLINMGMDSRLSIGTKP